MDKCIIIQVRIEYRKKEKGKGEKKKKGKEKKQISRSASKSGSFCLFTFLVVGPQQGARTQRGLSQGGKENDEIFIQSGGNNGLGGGRPSLL